VPQAELAQGRTGQEEELVDEISRASGRAAELPRQLLAFARRQPLQPRVVDLYALVREAEPMLRRVLGEDVELEIKLASESPIAKVDPLQVETALLNLCVNARDAMPKGGTVIVETGRTTFDEHYARDNADASPGPHAMIAVSDTGSGIRPEHLPRIFEPFFTTKPATKGTGLGLATVYGFVTQSGGHVK